MMRPTLGLVVLFLIFALIAALFGFGIVSAESWVAAKVFFFIFLALAVLTLAGSFHSRREEV